MLAWFDHYLRDEGPTPADDFTYFRPWVYDAASGSPLERARAAYGVAPSYPLPGPGTVLRLSGSDALVGAGQPAQPGSVSVVAPAAGVGSYSETSVLGALVSYEHPVSQPPPSDPPGTAATYTGQPLAAPLDVVGVPQAVVHLVTGEQTADPSTHLVLFGKVEDVAPDGSVELIERLVSPVRVADPTQPVTVQLPGIVHRFSASHRVRLVIASSDLAYAGNPAGRTFTVLAGGSSLTLPTVGSDAVPAAVVPEAPRSALLPLAGLAAAGALLLRRRRGVRA